MKFFIFQQQLHDPNFTILTIFLSTSTQMGTAFVYCYFGKMATDSYRNMSDRVFNMNWQELSVNQQKYIIVMIANMQRPLFYHGSGIVDMDLNTFINVNEIFKLNHHRLIEQFYNISSAHQKSNKLLHDFQENHIDLIPNTIS